MYLYCLVALFSTAAILLQGAQAQVQSRSSSAQTAESQKVVPTVKIKTSAQPIACPGSFPTDLSVTDCRFYWGRRWEQFITGSVTDQAIGGTLFYGAIAQARRSPPEWRGNWEGYGRRIGVRYSQGVAKGAAEIIVGWMMNDDPRHVAYDDDRHFVCKHNDAFGPDNVTIRNAVIARRVVHAVYDTITIRRSTIHGTGCRLPAISRFVGDFASAYGGYPWYRHKENTFPNVGLRAASAFGSAFVPSFYAEFKPEIARTLGAIFRRGRTTSTAKK